MVIYYQGCARWATAAQPRNIFRIWK